MTPIQAILIRNGINPRPSYYSGRGATTTDLTSNQLINIQKDIKERFGEEAEKNYIQMVKAIPVLSATSFIITLTKLSQRKWIFADYIVDKEGVSMDGMGSAFGTFTSMLGFNQDETATIKTPFLLHNGIRPEQQVRVSPNGMTYRLY